MYLVDDWRKSETIKLPWTGETTKYTIDTLSCTCAECGDNLESMRGDIYESFGTVEVSGGGLCKKCNKITPFRCRVYPKTNIFMRKMNGEWKKYKMKSVRRAWMDDAKTITRRIMMRYVLTTVLLGLFSVNKEVMLCFTCFVAIVIVLTILATYIKSKK